MGRHKTVASECGRTRPWSPRASQSCAVVGAACLWAWGYVVNLSTALFPTAGVVDSIGIELAYYTSQLTLLVLGAALAGAVRRWHPSLPPAAVVGSAVALAAASATLALLMRAPGAPAAAVVACGAVYGAAGLVLTMAWGARFSLGSRAWRRLVLLSFLLGYVIYLAFLSIPSGVSALSAAMLPLVSGALWLLDSWRRHLLTCEVRPNPDARRHGASASGEVGARNRAGGQGAARADMPCALGEVSAGSVEAGLLPWRTMALFGAAALVGNFVSSFLMGATYEGASVIFPGGFLVGGCITLAALAFLAGGQARLSVERLYRYCLPFAALGLLLILAFPGRGTALPGALVTGAGVFLQVLVFLKITEATQETGVSPLLSFSVGQALVGGVVCLGSVGGRLLSGLPGASETVLPIVCAAGVFALFFLLVMTTDAMAQRLEEAGRTTANGTDVPLGEVGGPDAPCGAAGVSGPGRGNGFQTRLDAFAEELGLTPRETEVCGLLVQGRSLPFIAEQLFVTTGTVKTHALHVYRKAGVGGKQELISLFEQRGRR